MKDKNNFGIILPVNQVWHNCPGTCGSCDWVMWQVTLESNNAMLLWSRCYQNNYWMPSYMSSILHHQWHFLDSIVLDSTQSNTLSGNNSLQLHFRCRGKPILGYLHEIQHDVRGKPCPCSVSHTVYCVVNV